MSIYRTFIKKENMTVLGMFDNALYTYNVAIQ